MGHWIMPGPGGDLQRCWTLPTRLTEVIQCPKFALAVFQLGWHGAVRLCRRQQAAFGRPSPLPCPDGGFTFQVFQGHGDALGKCHLTVCHETGDHHQPTQHQRPAQQLKQGEQVEETGMSQPSEDELDQYHEMKADQYVEQRDPGLMNMGKDDH